ncbi:hypothetical protein FB563_4081 [Streptomyces puniciscabiei]|uniref:SpaA-like prealbumin fold domain-containing protein n=1 Tax=Streptomyces puniciscabiei TaxID=164348 RepID=A0A542UIY1_9ACTN|nr:SpaA isopeptide-forming pilin-related protein [Streptomyces puniciscabiei]TQK99028.1 hypothetical protein FB563_4081 [Streptomyces puniciscabiei]
MRTRMPTAALVVAAAVTGTLACVPTASAHAAEPTPATSAVPTGGVQITKKDAGGDLLAGASFTLLDTTGKEVAQGKTDTDGKLAFNGLAAGVYRLKEVSSGNPLLDVVADQDVIVTPGVTTPLTITDPFKAAKVLLQAKDDKTGKLLSGATVNIGTGASTLLTLTTGAEGTASGELPVSSRKTEFWVKQVKAPAGYDLYKTPKTFTAGPGAPVTVTVTNTRTATNPKPHPSDKPTQQPTSTPSTPADKPGSDSGSTKPSAPSPGTPDADPSSTAAAVPDGGSMPATQAGSLAHTGADGTPWIAAGAGLLVVAGAVTLIAVRRRTAAEPEPDDNSKTN